jgi:uncharacterized protein YukE
MAAESGPAETLGMTHARDHFKSASTTAATQRQRVQNEMTVVLARWGAAAPGPYGRAVDDWGQQFDSIIAELNHMIEIMDGTAPENGHRGGHLGALPCQKEKS